MFFGSFIERSKESSAESSPHSSVDVVEETEEKNKSTGEVRRADVAPRLDVISKGTK